MQLRKNDAGAALADFEAALSINPDNMHAHNNADWCL